MNKKLMQYNYSLKKEQNNKNITILLFVIFLFIFVNLIISFIVFPVRQNSTSMIPDIESGSSIFLSHIFKTPVRGDVVLISSKKEKSTKKLHNFADLCCRFFTLQQYSLDEKTDFPCTKPALRRVVAVPGDTIYMRDYVLYVKPASEKYFFTEFEVTEKPYNVTFFTAPASWDGSLGLKGSFDQIVLGKDEYFVLSDNRKSSEDSRLWGVVHSSQIKSKALFLYFPFNKIKFF